ncbi:MAG TPA: zinc ribbon domain-containing protein [Nevskiales bacterium]|nr:zinc ribbon domain-containing protein [Nevskiales bacterium]
MPIYEYLCRACGRETERLQKLSDNPLTDCPDCGQPSLVRKISAPSFRLKGGGWYETDFKSDKEKKRNLAGDAAKPSETKPDGAAAKSEAKPAPAAAQPATAGKTESA